MEVLSVKSRRRHRERNTFGLPQGDRIRRELRAWFKAQRRAVVSYLKTGRIATKDETGGDIPQNIPSWDSFGLGDLPMAERMTPLLESIWDDAGQAFTAKLGLDPDSWSVVNPHTQEAINQASLDFCESTNATTHIELDDALRKTREALSEGLITRGDSVADLTRRVNEIFSGAETWRARRIAASEASRATHAAQEMAAAESGVVTGWKWLLSEDACPMCQVVARKAPAVKMGQPFAIVGDNPKYNTIKFPPLHPGCQCSLVEVLDIDPQPKWSQTLVDPTPEEQDYAEGEAPQPKQPKPAAVEKPKPLPKRKPKRDEEGINAPASPDRPRPGKVNRPITDYLPYEPHAARIDRDALERRAVDAPKAAVSPVPVAMLRVEGDRIGPFQTTVNERIVEHYRDSPPKAPIVTIFDENKFWIFSGHHRAAAAVERGDFSLPGLIFRRKPGTAGDPELMRLDAETGAVMPYEPE